VPGSLEFIFCVPQDKVGLVIGNQATKINEIYNKTGAKYLCLKTREGTQNEEATFVIYGLQSQINEAMKIIENLTSIENINLQPRHSQANNNIVVPEGLLNEQQNDTELSPNAISVSNITQISFNV